jgi:hypothetical protein
MHLSPQSPSNVGVNPASSHIIYPSSSSSSSSRHYLTASLTNREPRALPIPAGTHISTTPDGDYLVVFHPMPVGGVLAVYPSTILSPLVTDTRPLMTFDLPSAPLALVHLYPHRLDRPEVRGLPAGPLPVGHPAILVLTRTGISLIHIDGFIPNLVCSVSQRSYSNQTRSGSRSTDDNEQGWLCLIPGSTSAWAGVQTKEEVIVVKIDCGFRNSAPCGCS